MGEWRTVFEEEVEGRLVTVKIYQSEDTADDDGDEGPCVLEDEDGDTLLLEREDAGRLMTLEPYSLDDLAGELMEIGFSPEAAASVASKVPG